MPRITDTNNRQSAFLRAFLDDPSGPPRDQWPTPARLRLWLNRPGFRRAYNALVRATQRQAEFLVHIGSLHAARDLTASFAPDQPAELTVAQRIRDTETLKLALRCAAAHNARRRRRDTAAAAPEPLDPDDDYTGLTPEQIAIRLAHPNCRPEVAIANFRRDLHPFYDEHEYDMTTNPPTLLRLNPRCPTPPLYPPAPPAAPEHPGDHPAPDKPAAATASAGT